jgi:hypothetical protein
LTFATYLTAPYAAQYRLIVDVLLDQQQHSLTGIAHVVLEDLVGALLAARHPSVAASLLADGFDFDARMRSLVEWGVVVQWQDRQDRLARREDFSANAHRYQLTAQAAALHRAVAVLGADEAAQVAATLAPQVLAGLLDKLAELLLMPDVAAQVAAHGAPTAVPEVWATITPTLQGMARAAASWQARLAGALAGAPDETKDAVLQDTIRRYVEMWGAGIDQVGDAIVERCGQLSGLSDQTWRTCAVAALGAEAEEGRLAEYIADIHATLATLHAWFAGPASQSRRLRRQIRDTIVPMIRGQRMLAAVGGRVSRRAELLGLAARLERAQTDEAAWDIWCSSTGLFSARHLPGASPMPAGSPSALSFCSGAGAVGPPGGQSAGLGGPG